MAYSKCFVPGCKTGYASDRKRRKAEGKEVPSLFLAPRDHHLRRKWMIAIRRKDKELSPKHMVCALHFTEDCLKRVYETPMPDGTIDIIQRGRAGLVAGSVPTIFPHSAKETPRKKRGKAPKNHKKSKHRKSRINSDEEFDLMDLSFEESGNENISLYQSPALSVNRKLSDEQFSYNYLEANLKQVQKPNSKWTIFASPCNTCIVCCIENPDSCQRKVVIYKDLSAKVCINQVEIPLHSLINIDIDSIETLSILLHKVDSLVVFKI